MKKHLLFTSMAIIIAVSLLQNCQKPGCIGKAGPSAVQERAIPVFSRVVLNDNIDLVLIQSDTEKIEITAPENILPNIQTDVTGDLLTIANTAECRWLRNPDEKIKVKLYFRNFTNLDYNGSGNVTNEDTLRMDYLRCNSETGAGNIDLKVDGGVIEAILLKENASMTFHGRAEYCQTYTNARGILDLSDLTVKNMYMIYSGLADTHITVSGNIELYIRYKGNVYCKGAPTVTKKEYYSSGRLILVP